MGGRASRVTAWSEDGGVGRRPNKKGTVYRANAGTCGYKIPPHTHPTAENLTVISGTFDIGTGDRVDEAAGKALEAGGFVVLPAGMKHYAWSTTETVLQIHGKGPFEIKYVNPADDPRNAKK
jgi:quercetin dioxygenase-like cupin family protein